MKTEARPILLVGGGSGGHIFPLVAIGEQLKASNIPFIYVGSEGSLEQRTINSLGWEFSTISAGKWRRYSNFSSFWLNIGDLFRIIKGIFQSIRLIKETRASLIVSKGGYVALPLLYAARLTKCPLIVHESDSIMGLTNKVGAKFAKKVLTAFDVDSFPGSDERYQKVGIPIRKSLRQSAGLRSPKKVRPLILVLPGSQGATAINNYLGQALPQLLKQYDIVHLTGERDYPIFEKIKSNMPKQLVGRYKPYKFIDREMPYYYQSADLIIGRGSATIAAEAALFSKPLYIIPLPNSASNHQFKNGQLLENAGAAFVRQQYQLSGEQLIEDIIKLMSDTSKLQSMGESLAKYFNSGKSIEEAIKVIKDAY